VGEELARIVTKMTEGMSEVKLKEKWGLYKRPQNCELVVPKVNSELWSGLNHNTKSSDLRMQRQQKMLLKVVYALLQIADGTMKNLDNENKSQFKVLMDAIGITLKSVRELSLDRRSRILQTPTVNAQYRRLASAEIPITTWLFGDDIRSAVASIDSSSRLRRNFKGRKSFPNKSAKNWKGKYAGKTWNWKKNENWSRGQGRQSNYQYHSQKMSQTQKKTHA